MDIEEAEHGRKISATIIAICLGFLSTVSEVCYAQASSSGVDLRYETFLKDTQKRNETTPGNEFGDQHSLESGAISLNVVDANFSGNNGLAVEFRRILDLTEVRPQPSRLSRLANWDLGLPKIQGSFDSKVGWITSDPDRPTKNCSVTPKGYMSPPSAEYQPIYQGGFPVYTDLIFSPPSVNFPGGGSRMLVYNDGSMQVPTSGGPYFWLTADHDAVECITTLKNRNDASSSPEERVFGQGEGYLVKRADGTKYWFDWIAKENKVEVSTSFSYVCDTIGNCGYPLYVYQVTLALYPTRVEDRFGNWVKYTYSNKSNELIKLDRIESNDGRRIDVGYVDGRIDSVTGHGRTWKYIYASPTQLAEVRNPDQSSWKYSASIITSLRWPSGTFGRARCDSSQLWTEYVNPDPTEGDANGSFETSVSVENPAGASAVFSVGGVMLGRSGVPKVCHEVAKPDSFSIQEPLFYLGGYKLALYQKQVTGPGLTPMVWKYAYQSDIGFSVDKPTGSTRTKILGPNGALDTYVFGNTYNLSEGLLLSHTRSFSGTVFRQETNAYAIKGAISGFPKQIGYHTNADNRTGDVFLRPQTSSAKTEQFVKFNWSVDMNCGANGTTPCFDERARPTKMTRKNLTN